MSGYRARLTLVIAATLVVCAAFYMFFVKSRQDELADVRKQVEAAEDESVSLQAQLDELQALKENAPKAEARLNEIRDLVPQDDQVANFIFQVQDAANRAGVDFVTVTPEQPKAPVEDPSASVAQVRVTLGAESSDYFAIQDLVRRLYDLDRAVRIDNLALDADEDEDSGVVTITMTAAARIFFENRGGAPGTVPGTTTSAPGTTTESTTTTPGSTTTTTPSS
jgi:Tfp pilus assembly protein PilO